MIDFHYSHQCQNTNPLSHSSCLASEHVLKKKS